MKKIITTLFACALGIGVAAYAQTSGQSGSQTGYPQTGAGSSMGSDQSSGFPAGSSSTGSEDQWGTGSSSQPGVGSSSSSGSSTGAGSSDDSSQWNQQQQQQKQQQPSSTGSSSSTPSSGSSSSTGAGSGSMGSMPGMGQEQQAMGQWPSQVTAVSVMKGKKVELAGSLTNAQSVDNFGLPTTCLTSAEKQRFGTNQVLYSFELPANVDATIDVKAADAATKLGVYAYALPQSKFDMPSSSLSPNACKVAIKGQSSGAHVLRIKGAKDAQNVLIGVAALNAPATGTGSSLQKKSIDKSSSSSSSNIGGSSSGVSNDKGKDVGGTGSSSDKGSFDKGDLNKSNDVYNKTQTQPLKDRDLSGDINHDKGQVSSTQGDLYLNNGFSSPNEVGNNTTQSGSHAGMSTGTGSSIDNGAYNQSDKSLGSSSSVDKNSNTGTGSSSDIGSSTSGSQDNAQQPSSSQKQSSHKSMTQKSTEQESSSSSSTIGTGAGTGTAGSGDFTVTIDLH